MTPRVAELLAELSLRGVRVTPDRDKLRLSPRSALTPELLLRVKALKPELLSVLCEPLPRSAGLTRAEWVTLEAIAEHPGLRLGDLRAATGLAGSTLDFILTVLHSRREISVASDGCCRLIVH